jgi:hypothetical protein
MKLLVGQLSMIAKAKNHAWEITEAGYLEGEAEGDKETGPPEPASVLGKV